MRPFTLLLIATLALCSGCMKFSQTLTLNADGSGLLDITYTLPEETVTQISGMVKLADELARTTGEPPPGEKHGYLEFLLNPSENRIKSKIASYNAEGLTLTTVKVESRDGRRHVTLQLAFDRIASLAQTDFFADQGFTLTRQADGNYRLARKGIQDAAASSVDMTDPQVVRQIAPILGGFEAVIGVKVPGRIIEANTTRRSLRQAVWNFEFNRDPQDFRAFYTRDLVVIFEGAGLTIPTE